MIRRQSNVAISNIHTGTSSIISNRPYRIVENHHAYSQLTRFRVESLYWLTFVTFARTRDLNVFFFSFLPISHALSSPLRPHLVYTEANNLFYYTGHISRDFPPLILYTSKCHSAHHKATTPFPLRSYAKRQVICIGINHNVSPLRTFLRIKQHCLVTGVTYFNAFSHVSFHLSL